MNGIQYYRWDYGTILTPALCAVPITHFAIASSERPERRSSYYLQSNFFLALTETGRKKEAKATYTLLNFRNLENMFQRQLASEFLAWIVCALHFTLDFGDVCSFPKQPGCSGGAEIEGKRSVRADSDAGGDRDALARSQSSCLTD